MKKAVSFHDPTCLPLLHIYHYIIEKQHCHASSLAAKLIIKLWSCTMNNTMCCVINYLSPPGVVYGGYPRVFTPQVQVSSCNLVYMCICWKLLSNGSV